MTNERRGELKVVLINVGLALNYCKLGSVLYTPYNAQFVLVLTQRKSEKSAVVFQIGWMLPH